MSHAQQECILPKNACFLSTWGRLMLANQSSASTFSGNLTEVSGTATSRRHELNDVSNEGSAISAKLVVIGQNRCRTQEHCWLRESKGTDVLEIQLVYPITTEKEQLHTWGKEDHVT